MAQQTLEAAKTVFSVCMGAKPGEQTLILTDDGKLDLAHVFAQAGRELGLGTTLVEVPQQKGGEIPALAAAALEKADAALFITSGSFTHTKARAEANARGCRIASMPMITKEIVDKTCGADYSEIKAMSDKIAALFDAASTIRVTTALGTDISLDVRGRKGIADTGILTEKGAFGNLPAGESMIAPVEDRGDGVLVVDGVIAGIGVLKKPVTLTIKDGKISSIEGDDGKLRAYLGGFAANIDKIAEFGVGTNRLTEICGNPLCDEKVFSTVHFGFGNNLFMGGRQDCNMHFDMIVRAPTVYLDGSCVIKDGSHIY